MNSCHRVICIVSLALALAAPHTHATTIIVTNLAHSNGWYSFQLMRGDGYFQLGGAALMRSLVLHPHQPLAAAAPAGWLAQLDATSTVSFICTNADALIGLTNALPFAFQSAVLAEVLYSDTDTYALYPQGVALGELYGPDTTPVTPALDGYASTVNAAAQERFPFLGPLIPEPSAALALCAALCISRLRTPLSRSASLV